MVSVDSEFFENFLPNIQAIIFDMDGTLFDLNVNWQKVRNKLDEHTKNKYRLGNGPIFQTLFTGFKEVEKRFGKAAVEELEGILMGLEHRDAIEKSKPKDLYRLGIKWIENKSPEKKILAIVSSNFRKTLDDVLKKHNNAIRFDMIISREDVEQMKPNPEGLIKVIDKYDLSPSNCIYIGDLKSDEDAANAAGMLFLYAQDLEIHIKNAMEKV
jgi:HAD superfamily hydrolase (TIGR01549 family)